MNRYFNGHIPRYFAALVLACLWTILGLAQSNGAPPKLISDYLKQDELIELAWTERLSLQEDVFVQGYQVRSQSSGIIRRLYLDNNGQPVQLPWLPSSDPSPSCIYRQSAEFVDDLPLKGNESALKPSNYWQTCPELVFEPPSSLKDISLTTRPEEEKGLRQIGVVESLASPVLVTDRQITGGEWFAEPDGSQVWLLRIRYLDAVGLRMRVSELTLPPEVSLYLYAAEVSSDNPVIGITEAGWAPTIAGESLVLELRVPPDGTTDTLRIRLDQIGYLFEDPTQSWKKVGACHNDMACFPEYHTISLAVGRLSKVDQEGLWSCTGVLLADTVIDTQIPYLLTANHCIPNQTEASSLEVYWQYAAATCGGAAPNLAEVPKTIGGALFLAGATSNTGSDFAFLRLKKAPPAGVIFAGYSTEPVAVDTPVLAVHHPQGEVQRLSLGRISDQGRPGTGLPLVSRDYFREVLWEDGSTEPGSSGCPLLLRDSSLVVGQLYGGYASCGDTTEPDYFGRFDVTYNIISRWLAPQEPLPEEGEGEGEGEVEGEGEEENPQCTLFSPKGMDGVMLSIVIGLLVLIAPGKNGRV